MPKAPLPVPPRHVDLGQGAAVEYSRTRFKQELAEEQHEKQNPKQCSPWEEEDEQRRTRRKRIIIIIRRRRRRRKKGIFRFFYPSF